MSSPASSLVQAVRAYSARTLPELLRSGPATSALAPWMLAALVAPGASGAVRETIEQDLGMPAQEAQREVAKLLTEGPTALRSAITLWRSPLLASDGAFGAWERGVPAPAASGPIPSQAAADAWTERETLGLIHKFPIEITPLTVCLLAAAIATKIRWDRPLGVTAAPANAWDLQRMLKTQAKGVYATESGRVAVAASWSTAERLAVYSFLGQPDSSREALIATALDLIGAWHPAARLESGSLARPISLDALPISLDALPVTGHAWAVEEGYGSDDALVPAFEERCDGVNILALAGVHEAAGELGRLVEAALPPGLRPVNVEAKMSALARYDRLGFEAAAVAAMGVLARGMPRPRKTLHLRFDRPHLVLAVATDAAYAGLPLFAAWVDGGVREPDESSS